MLKVGITGGIGSGKSTVSAVFEVLGIPVLYADDTARLLMESDAGLISAIKALFGDPIYTTSGTLDRKALSALIFQDKEKLAKLNALVHPTTIQYGLDWMNSKATPYAIKEAAIFFESGSNIAIDVMVGVYAPQELRIDRVMRRSSTTREEVLARIAQQMDEDEKMKRCDFVIVNDDQQAVLPQVLRLHQQLIDRSKSG